MDIDCIKCFTDLLKGFLTPIIAITTGIIAYRQWKDSRYKIKVDLFDKRMKVYEIIKNQLIIINRDTEPEIDHLQFYSALSQSKFLFNNKVYTSIEQIYSKIMDNLHAAKRLKDHEESQERHNLFADQYAETSKWLIARQNSFEDIFSEFMTLNKI